MKSKNLIVCAKCGSPDAESVVLAYQTIKSRDAGQRFILQDPVTKKPITAQKREQLLKKLSPPQNPDINLPAGAVALMAFLISWLATATFIIGRIGLKNYFIVTGFVVVVVVGAFYYMLKTAVINLGHVSTRYKNYKDVWEKQYFCHECENIFVP